ncbi:MAG TPA: hypothetical protein VK171_08895, partial [Fimbriimonas sp.]|nr:hypothetical protein [Fimbriimonas sp.]
TTRQLGSNLDLPDSPVFVLGGAASGNPSILFIDQLDAVSSASGRNPQHFQLVVDMLDEAGAFSTMKIVLACRTFDVDNDDRIRKLLREPGAAVQVFSVGLLNDAAIDKVLEECGFDLGRFSGEQRRILSVPLNLKLLSEIEAPDTFETEHDLFERYWEFKLNRIRQVHGDFTSLFNLLDEILAEMTRAQSFSVLLEKYRQPHLHLVETLLTEGVLIQDGKRLSFFHESFFDYLFASRFVNTGKDLLEFLHSREQHLFIRGMVRQILSHIRSQDRQVYLRTLKGLLSAPTIRFHIKRLVFQWLRASPAPQNDEWEVVKGLRANGDPDVVLWADASLGALPWFNLLDETGWIAEELTCGEPERETWAANYVVRFIDEVPDRVGQIVLLWLKREAPWPQYAFNALQRVYRGHSRYFVEIYKELLPFELAEMHEAPFSIQGSTFLYSLPEEKPEWATEILAAWLTFRLNQLRSIGITNPFSYGLAFDMRLSADLGDRLTRLAEGAPVAFADRLLPIVLELIAVTARLDGDQPWRDEIWSWSTFNSHYSFSDQLMEGLVRALCLAAGQRLNEFSVHEDLLRRNLQYKTVGWILA